MTLQAKLTLGSVGLATILVSGISAVGLGNLMRHQFKDTYERADLIKTAATDAAIDALNRQRSVDLKEAVKDSTLNAQFVKLLTSYKPILEISLVSAETNEILASTLSHDAAAATPVAYPRNPDFAPLALHASWLEQLQVLMRKEPQSYKLEEAVGPGGVTQLFVRVLVTPTLIRDSLWPSFEDSVKVAIVTIAVAVFLTFLASTLAFRPLGRISRMLDLVARGEYESEKAAASDQSNDEF